MISVMYVVEVSIVVWQAKVASESLEDDEKVSVVQNSLFLEMIILFCLNAAILCANSMYLIFYFIVFLFAQGVSITMSDVSDIASFADNLPIQQMHLLPIGIVVFYIL